MKLRRKLAIGLGLTALALVSQASSAPAAVTFGSDLSQTPGAGCTDCAALTIKTTAGTDLEGSPVNGTLTSARVRTRVDAGTGAFRILRANGPLTNLLDLNFVNAGEAPVTVTADASLAGHVTEVGTHLPIAIGDRLAVSFPDQDMYFLHMDPDAICAYRAEGPVQPVGSTATYSADGCGSYEALIAGTVDPDNSVELGKAKSLKGGKAKLPVTAPNAGVVQVTGFRTGAASAGKGKSPIKPTTASLSAPGTVTLTLKPSKAGRRLLAQKGRVKTSIEVSFTPTGGSASTKGARVTLKNT